VRECSVLLHNIILQVDITDKWRWTLDTAHRYSVREAYRYITSYGDQVDRSLVDNVWYRRIPAKVFLFVWRLLRNRLPTRDNLLWRNIIHATESLCVAGCEVLETSRHLFLACRTLLTLCSIGLACTWYFLMSYVVIIFSFVIWRDFDCALTLICKIYGMLALG
jgi:hypothetical protein